GKIPLQRGAMSRRHDTELVAEPVQGNGQGSEHVGQASGLGEGCDLRSDHGDLHFVPVSIRKLRRFGKVAFPVPARPWAKSPSYARSRSNHRTQGPRDWPRHYRSCSIGDGVRHVHARTANFRERGDSAILTHPTAEVADLSQGLDKRGHGADLFEAETGFALPVRTLLPGAGNVLRRGFEPKVLQIDEE